MVLVDGLRLAALRDAGPAVRRAGDAVLLLGARDEPGSAPPLRRRPAARAPGHREGPHASGRRAARSAIYALHHGEGEDDEDLPSMLRRLSGVHMPDELRVEVRIGGEPVPLPAECEQSLFRVEGEALFNTAVHADASRAVVRLAYGDGQVRLTIADDGHGRPEEVRRSLRAASVACPSGEHRGLVSCSSPRRR